MNGRYDRWMDRFLAIDPRRRMRQVMGSAIVCLILTIIGLALLSQVPVTLHAGEHGVAQRVPLHQLLLKP